MTVTTKTVSTKTVTVRNQNVLPTGPTWPTQPTDADMRRLDAMLEAEEQIEQGGKGLPRQNHI